MAAAQDQVEKQLCLCLTSMFDKPKVLLDLLIDEKGRTEQFASDPLLDEGAVSCLQSALSKMQFAVTGLPYHVQRDVQFPSSCVAAEAGGQKPEPQPSTQMSAVQKKSDQKRWIRMKTAGIVLLPVGGAATAWSLLFFFIFSICMDGSESAGTCTGPPYKLLILTGAGVELMLIGALLLGIGHSYLKRTAEASHPRPWPSVALAPYHPGGVMSSLAWRF